MFVFVFVWRWYPSHKHKNTQTLVSNKLEYELELLKTSFECLQQPSFHSVSAVLILGETSSVCIHVEQSGKAAAAARRGVSGAASTASQWRRGSDAECSQAGHVTGRQGGQRRRRPQLEGPHRGFPIPLRTRFQHFSSHFSQFPGSESPAFEPVLSFTKDDTMTELVLQYCKCARITCDIHFSCPFLRGQSTHVLSHPL